MVRKSSRLSSGHSNCLVLTSKKAGTLINTQNMNIPMIAVNVVLRSRISLARKGWQIAMYRAAASKTVNHVLVCVKVILIPLLYNLYNQSKLRRRNNADCLPKNARGKALMQNNMSLIARASIPATAAFSILAFKETPLKRFCDKIIMFKIFPKMPNAHSNGLIM